MYEFDRDICKGSVNPRSGKIVAEKVVRYYEDKLRCRVSVKMSLNTCSGNMFCKEIVFLLLMNHFYVGYLN